MSANCFVQSKKKTRAVVAESKSGRKERAGGGRWTAARRFFAPLPICSFRHLFVVQWPQVLSNPRILLASSLIERHACLAANFLKPHETPAVANSPGGIWRASSESIPIQPEHLLLSDEFRHPHLPSATTATTTFVISVIVIIAVIIITLSRLPASPFHPARPD
jgi:hypothetical protein